MKKKLLLRLPLLTVFFFFILLIFSANNLLAQDPVIISVSIVETGWNKINDKGKNKLVWRFFKGESPHLDSILRNEDMEACFAIKSKKNKKVKEISDKKDDLRPFIADISGFKITMEAFLNKKGGDKCIPDLKDANYGIRTEKISLHNLAPGIWSEEIKIQDAYGVFFAVFVYKYKLTKGLSIIESSRNSLVNDASKNLTLSLPINLSNKETLPFTWSYSIGNEENWVTIPNSAENKSKIDFNPLKNIFENKQLSGSKNVKFKAEVEMGGKTESSEILTLTFAPRPPSFNKEKDMVIIPVCNGLANGGIEIKNIIASTSDIKYVLQKKTETAELCSLKQASAEVCPGFAGSGTVSAGKTLRIRSLATGEYILYIFNGDIESGEVNTPTQFTISELPPLKIIDAETGSKDPTCKNERGGEIYMNVEGNATLWQIVIKPNVIAPDKGRMTRDGNNILFKNLEAGNYTVYLSNQCGPEISKPFNLKKPKQISIDKENISTRLDKTFLYVMFKVKNGSNDYKVKVTDQDDITEEKTFLMDIEIQFSKVGTYTIEISDNTNPACTPAKVKIKVDKLGGKLNHKVIE